MPSINDTKHKLTDKEIVTSADSDDTIFVNIDGAVKQIAIKDALQVEGGIADRVTAVESDVDELNSNLQITNYFNANSHTSFEMAINALHKSLPDNTGFNGIMLYDSIGMIVCGARYNQVRGSYIVMSPVVNTLRKLRVRDSKIYMSEITCNDETSVDIS